MPSALLLELAYKLFALAVTVWVAQYLGIQYIEALVEGTRTYIAVVDLLYGEERLPVTI